MVPPRERVGYNSFLARLVGNFEVIAGEDFGLANLSLAQLLLLIEVLEVLVIRPDLERWYAPELSVPLLEIRDDGE